MKTLINGRFYVITDDAEVIYLNGNVIRISDDNYGNWGIVYHDQFIRLSVFEVDGVTWYFTSHSQELEIRELAQEILPARGMDVSNIEWFKTVALSDQEYNDEFAAYYKIRGLESYHSAVRHAGSEQEIIDLLLIKREEFQSLQRNSCVRGDGETFYFGHHADGFTLYLHFEENTHARRQEVMEKWNLYVPDTALEIYCYHDWLFYRESYSGKYRLDYFNNSESYNSLSDMEALINEVQKHTL